MRISKSSVIMAVLLFVAAATSYAQQISVGEFEKSSHRMSTESNQPAITFYTAETGFVFQADGEEDLKVKPGLDCISVELPRKTKFIKISHPSYGELYWKIPQKLRNRTFYQAYIHTWGPDKKFELTSQWVRFNISPPGAIVQIDSTLTLVRDGLAQFYLPLGTHHYSVESPFHERVSDSLVLDASGEVRRDIILHPFYSYMEVTNPYAESEIFVDGVYSGTGSSTGKRVAAGMHNIKLRYKGIYVCDTTVSVGQSEKRAFSLDVDSSAILKGYEAASSLQSSEESEKEIVTAHVVIYADSLSSIMINREPVGVFRWEGDLPEGYYIINSRSAGVESSPTQLWIKDSQPQEIRLYGAANDIGAINVYGNQADAKVYVDGVLCGLTPCVVRGLDAGRSHRIRLEKEGFRPIEQSVHPLGGSVVSVQMNLKKR